ncbi:MAG: PEP-CTERM sorting domain-containing protein [Pseudohongiellaceae bacterium]
MKMKIQSLTTLVVLSVLSASAAIIDQWTFNDPTTPQNSDIKGKTVSVWDPTLAGNSLAGGVLTWGYDNTTAFTTSSTTGGIAYQGAPWLGAPDGKPDQLVLTIDTKDINFSENGAYSWEFTGVNDPVRDIPSGTKVSARISYFNGDVSLRMAGGAAEWNGGNAYNQSDYTSITDLQLTFTWDFANGGLSVAASGSGVLAAGGTGNISYSNSNTSYTLTQVLGINSFRTNQQGQGDSYMQLDTVTIETISIPEPGSLALLALGLGVTVAIRRFKR